MSDNNRNNNRNFLFQAFLTVFKKPIFVVLAVSLTLNLLALYYFLLYRITTFEVFWASNTALYNWLSVISTVLISLLFGVAVSFLFWHLGLLGFITRCKSSLAEKRNPPKKFWRFINYQKRNE